LSAFYPSTCPQLPSGDDEHRQIGVEGGAELGGELILFRGPTGLNRSILWMRLKPQGVSAKVEFTGPLEAAAAFADPHLGEER
jgi:hypothetical protein